jgi:hypothetical protein
MHRNVKSMLKHNRLLYMNMYRIHSVRVNTVMVTAKDERLYS